MHVRTYSTYTIHTILSVVRTNLVQAIGDVCVYGVGQEDVEALGSVVQLPAHKQPSRGHLGGYARAFP